MNYQRAWRQEEEQPRAAAFLGSSGCAQEDRWESRRRARKSSTWGRRRGDFSLGNESGNKRCSVLNTE